VCNFLGGAYHFGISCKSAIYNAVFRHSPWLHTYYIAMGIHTADASPIAAVRRLVRNPARAGTPECSTPTSQNIPTGSHCSQQVNASA